jgi:hypothetical protein
MLPISVTNSNNSISVSPMPGVPFGAGPAVQRETGGFASTLAAAQGFAAQPETQTAGDEAGSSSSRGTGDANPLNGLNGRTPAWGNPQPKKLLNGSLPSTNPAAAVTPVVPGMVAAATTPISGLGPQANLAPELSASVQGLSGVAAASVAATLQAGGGAGSVTDPATTVFPSSQIGVASNGQVTSKTNGAAGPGLSAALPDAVAGSASAASSQEIQNALPTDLSTVSSSVNQNNYGSELSAGSAAPATGIILAGLNAAGDVLGSGIWAGATSSAADVPLQTANSSATVLAANENGPVLGLFALPSAASGQAGSTNSANAVAADTAPAINVAGVPETESAASEITKAQTSAAAILSSMAALAPEATLAAAKTSAAAMTPNIRGAALPVAGAPSSTQTSALPQASDSSSASAMANQTPFSVFFSGPGPGTEAAAGVLPRMILPGTSSAIRGSHAAGTEAPIANTQASSAQSAGAQNAAPQNPKDSQTGVQGGSSSSALPLHHDGDPTAAVQIASAPPAPAPAALPPPLSIAAPVADQTGLSSSLPKPETLPATAPGNSANAVPLPPEQAAVVPGPVQVAQIVSRVGQADMRIGMSTSAFGSVEVRTTVHANDVSLVVGSEKGDLRTLLANEIPTITNSLQQQNLRLNSVNFMQGFAFSNNNSGGGASQQQSFLPSPATAGLPSGTTLGETSEPVPAPQFAGGSSSLNILA